MAKQKKYIHGYFQLIVRLDDEDKNRLKQYAKHEKQNQTDVIRELIRTYCTLEND